MQNKHLTCDFPLYKHMWNIQTLFKHIAGIPKYPKKINMPDYI